MKQVIPLTVLFFVTTRYTSIYLTLTILEQAELAVEKIEVRYTETIVPKFIVL